MHPSVMLTILAAVQTAPPSEPGYRQQRVAYVITASLDEPSSMLSGVERVVHRNNSQDPLGQFALHLYLTHSVLARAGRR